MIPIKDKNVGLILKRSLNSEKDKKVPSLDIKSLIVWIPFVAHNLKYTGLFSKRIRELNQKGCDRSWAVETIVSSKVISDQICNNSDNDE